MRVTAIRWGIPALAALAAAVVCAAYRPLQTELVMDNQHYFYIAERAASGVAPHVSQIDSKSQLAPLLAAAAIAAARPFGGDDVVAARTMGIAMVVASVALAALLAFDLGGGAAGALAAAGLLFLARGLFVEGAAGVRPQVYVVFFLLAAHCADLHRRPLLAGSAAACSFLCWQPTLLVMASLAAAQLAHSRTSTSLGRLALGAALAVILYEGYFAWHGALGAQLFQEFVLPTFGARPDFELVKSFGFVLSDAASVARGGIRTLPALALAGMATGWGLLLLRPRTAIAALLERPPWLALWLAANGALAFTLYDHQAHPDLLFVQPYFAVGVGAAVAGLAQRLLDHRGQAALVVAASVVALIGVREALVVGEDHARRQGTLADQRALAAELEVALARYASVWACGPVHLLGLLHLDNFTPHGFLYDDLIASGVLDGFRPLRAGSMPGVILLSRNRAAFNPRWLGQEYRAVTSPRFRAARITMLVRR